MLLLPLLPPPAESPLVGVFCFFAELLSSQAVFSACLLCRRRSSCTARLGKVVGGPGPSLSRQCPGALPAGVRSALPSTGTCGGCGLGRPRLACGTPSPSAMGCSRFLRPASPSSSPPYGVSRCTRRFRFHYFIDGHFAVAMVRQGVPTSYCSLRFYRGLFRRLQPYRVCKFSCLIALPSWNLPTAGSQTWGPLRFQFLSRVLGMFCASSDEY